MAVSDGKKIRYVILRNGGGFVAKLIIKWELTESSGGCEARTQKGEMTIDKFISLGKERKVDLSEHGIPNGATISAKAFIKWGDDVTASQHHTYDINSLDTSLYVVTGTIWAASIQEQEL